ncbi:MAG: glycosyltransferase involved in cell wall biosynthesis [Chlamydiales bacterium]|jgi:glycosyltransferase involved in cell wall biosynthesis
MRGLRLPLGNPFQPSPYRALSQSLRIALLLNPFTLKRRGPGHATELARELLGRGHTVRGFGAPIGHIPRSASDPRVEGGVAPEDGMGLRGFNPDVILAYDALSPAAWLGARRARSSGAALVLVDEGFPDQGHPFRRFLRATGKRLWGSFVRRTALRLVVSDAAAIQRVRGLGFPEAILEEVYGGVDLVGFRPGLSSHLYSEHGIRGRTLLSIGRLEESRGIDVLIRAFAQTVGRRDDWSLVLAGRGGAKPALRALADRLGVGSSVHWLGSPRREERAGLMGSATMLALPTLDEDVGSLTVRQALACGLPVLASDLRRLRSYVDDDGTGLLVEPGNVDAWAEAIRLSAGAPERRARWRQRARAVAEERFSWPSIADRFEGIMLEALAQRELLVSRRGTKAGAPAAQEG